MCGAVLYRIRGEAAGSASSEMLTSGQNCGVQVGSELRAADEPHSRGKLRLLWTEKARRVPVQPGRRKRTRRRRGSVENLDPEGQRGKVEGFQRYIVNDLTRNSH